jgi:hypothetical protein
MRLDLAFLELNVCLSLAGNMKELIWLAREVDLTNGKIKQKTPGKCRELKRNTPV